jgi:lipopolysaccharide transport system ATP-binding protein
MSDLAINIENLGKRYTIGRRRDVGDDLRHTVERAIRAPISWLRARHENRVTRADFWALRNVSFEIKQGEVVGILGPNGAGKSTLLRLLSRITVPTEGRICIDGRIASLLEVGTGFHPELTGRENIFLNGAILGMARTEIIRKFDEIVAFSEIEDFLDTPVKRYSSGMYVRLAFGVAAHLDPEILIVDEVLAVGDTAFQKKCLAKMGAFAQSGRTILFVSHNLDAVRALCQRGIWLKNGHMHRDGNVDDVIDEYFNDLARQNSKSLANPDYEFAIESVKLKNVSGEESNHFYPGEDLVVEISYNARKRIERPMLAVGIVGANGSCFTANMLLDGHRPDFLEGSGQIKCVFRSIPLLPQNYSVKLNIRAATITDMIVPYQEVAYLTVVGDLADYGYRGEYAAHAKHSTHVVVPYEWQFPDGRSVSVALNRAPSRILSLAQSND